MITGPLDDYGQTILTQGHSYALYGIKNEEKIFIIRDPRGEANEFKTEFIEVPFNQLIYLFTNMLICKLNMDYVFTQHSV